MKNFLILAATLFVSACAPHINAGINGFASSDFNNNLVHAVSPTSEAQKGDLQFAEISAQTSRAISAAGLVVNNDVKQPDVVVFLDYGISNPEKSTSISSTPIYGQTGVSSALTTGTVSSFGNTANYNGVTSYAPTYGVVGYNNVPTTTTTYTRALSLTAIDYPKFLANKSLAQLWKITITSSGSSDDLRSVIPLMLNAAIPYIGKSTNQIINTQVSFDDPATMYIKTGQSVIQH